MKVHSVGLDLSDRKAMLRKSMESYTSLVQVCQKDVMNTLHGITLEVVAYTAVS